jgi:hypothetical protein
MYYYLKLHLQFYKEKLVTDITPTSQTYIN